MERFRGGTALQQTPSSSILPGLHRAAFPASFDPFDEQRHILGICALRMLTRDAARRMRGLRKGLFPALLVRVIWT
ncbi:hypothetical protein RB213_002639 [Colletotrichum asianum]